MNIGEMRQIMIEGAAMLREIGSDERAALSLANRLQEAQQHLFEYASSRALSEQGELTSLRQQRDGAMMEALNLRIQRDNLIAALEGFIGKVEAAKMEQEKDRQAPLQPEPTQAAQEPRYYAEPIFDHAPSDPILYWIVKDRQHPGQLVTDDSGTHIKQTYKDQEAAQAFAARLNRGEHLRANLYPIPEEDPEPRQIYNYLNHPERVDASAHICPGCGRAPGSNDMICKACKAYMQWYAWNRRQQASAAWAEQAAEEQERPKINTKGASEPQEVYQYFPDVHLINPAEDSCPGCSGMPGDHIISCSACAAYHAWVAWREGKGNG